MTATLCTPRSATHRSRPSGEMDPSCGARRTYVVCSSLLLSVSITTAALDVTAMAAKRLPSREKPRPCTLT